MLFLGLDLSCWDYRRINYRKKLMIARFEVSIPLLLFFEESFLLN